MLSNLAYEENVKVLGVPLKLKLSESGTNNALNILGVTVDGEARHLYVYISDIDAIKPNKREVNELVSEYDSQTGAVLKILIAISDALVWVVNQIMSIITAIFGNIRGSGIFGIVIVLVILYVLLMLWVYALCIIIPLMAISYGTRIWLGKRKEIAIKQLSRDARKLAKQCIKNKESAVRQLSRDAREVARRYITGDRILLPPNSSDSN